MDRKSKNAHRIREINEEGFKKRRKEEDDLEKLRNINEENKDLDTIRKTERLS
jgi:hypothetical protein